MADPTILEYRAVTTDLEAKLLNIKTAIFELEKQLTVPKELKVNVEDAENRLSLLRNRLNELNNSFKGLTNVKLSDNLKNELNREIAAVSGAEKSISKSLLDLSKNAINSNNAFVNSTAATANAVQGNFSKISNSVSKIASTVTELSSIIKFLVFSRIIRELVEFGKASVSTAVDLQALHNSFEAIIGDSEKADQKLAELRDTADTFGKGFFDVAENYLRFKIAGDAANLTAEATDAIYKSIIITSSALNQSQAQLNRTITAFEQVLSKGVLSAEEIRRQLGNALPGAFSLTARAIGVSNAELEKLLRSGTLLSNEVVPKIAAELLKTFSAAAIANVSSARAEFGRLQNDLLDIKKSIGDGLLPTLLEFSREISKATDDADFQGITNDVDYLAKSLKSVVDLLINVISLDISGALGGALEVVGRVLGSVSIGMVKLEEGILRLFSDEKADQAALYAGKVRDSFSEIIEEIKIWAGATESASDLAVKHNQRAAKAVQEVQEALDKLNKRGSLGTLIDELAKTEGNVGKVAKELQKIEDGLLAVEEKAKETGKISASSMLEFATKLEKIKLELEESGQFSGDLAVAIVELERKLGSAAVATALLNIRLKEYLNLKTPDQIRVTNDALQSYIDLIEDGGSVTREQADLIVKSIKDILDSIRELPPGQRAAFKDLEASLDGTLNQYKKFTTEAAKEAERLRKETAKAFEGLADEVGNIFDKLKEKLSGGAKESEALRDVEELKEELSGLQIKFDTSGLNSEELNRYNQLVSEIKDKQEDAGSAIREVFKNTNAEISKSFEDLILNNDKLIEGIARLSPAAQQSFISLVSGFNEVSKNSNLTELDLVDFGKRLSEIFKEAGINLDSFVVSLDSTASITEKILAKISDAKKEIESDQKNKLGESSESEISIDTSEGLTSVERLTAAVEKLSEIWVEEGESLKNVSRDREGEFASLEQLIATRTILNDKLLEGNLTLGQQQTAYKQLQEIQDKINQLQDEYTVSLGDLTTGQEDASESIDTTASSLVELSEQTKKAREQLDPITDQTRILKNTTDELSHSIRLSNDVNAEMNAAFEKSQKALEGLEAREDSLGGVVGEVSGKFKDGTLQLDQYNRVVETAKDTTNDASTQMKTAFDELDKAIEKPETRLIRIRDEIMPALIKLTETWKDIIDGVSPTTPR